MTGDIVLQNNGNLAATVGGNVQADVTGTVTVNAPAGTTINGPLHVTGPITSDKTITASDEIKSGDIGLQAHHHTEHDGPSTSPAKA